MTSISNDKASAASADEPSVITRVRQSLRTELQRPAGKGGPALAQELEDEIMRLGWPVGESLGSESELMERYGVGRSVLREAVGLLEQHSVARARRGPGGGLIVAKPDVASLARTFGLYLDFLGVTAGELRQLSIAVESASAELAALRITAEELEQLREMVMLEPSMTASELADHSREFHLAVAAATHNSVIYLMQSIWANFSWMIVHVDQPDEFLMAPLICADHEAIVEALANADSILARRLMIDHIMGLAEYWRDWPRDVVRHR